MPADEPSQAPSSGGIHVGDVGGNVTFRALGDIVGGDKIVNISTTIQISVEAVTQRPLVIRSPYRGLDRFEDRDKDLFFGRDQLIKSLLAQLSANNVLLVLGASGSGKSSVVRAGLLPALSGLLRARFRYFTLVPDVNPFESLRSSLHNGGFSQTQTRDLTDAQPGTPARLIHALQREGDQWLLFVDQFEEIFTLSEEPLRKSFIAALLEITQHTASSTKLVLAMRADFLDRFSPFPTFAKLIEKNIDLVADMHPDQLRLAIEQPAARHGVVFEQGLVEEIIKDVQGQAGSLPLLQYTLDLLWEEERRSDGLADRHLNTRSYRELGGVRGALQKRADEIYASFGDKAEQKRSSEKQEIVRQIFLRLVDIAGAGSDDTVWRPVRRRAAMASFSAAQEQELLQELINKKLLVSNREGTEAMVEVAHEALFTSWERLKKWIEGGKQVIFARNRLDDDARRWHQRQQEDSDVAEEELLSGSRLGQALEMRARGDFVAVIGGLSEMETQFLDASAALRDRRRQEEQGRQQRELATARALASEQTKRADDQSKAAARQQRLTMTMVLVSLLTVVAATFAWRQQRVAVKERLQSNVATTNAVANAREAKRQLAAFHWLQGATARNRDPVSPEATFWFLRSAADSESAGDQRRMHSALMAATASDPAYVCSLRHSNQVRGACCSRNGTGVLTWTAETALLWDVITKGAIRSFVHDETKLVEGAMFGPNETNVLTWSTDGTARLWALDQKEPVRVFRHHGPINGSRFHEDKTRLLTWSYDGTAQLWQLDSADPLQIFSHGSPVDGASFSGNGERVLTWSRDGLAIVWEIGKIESIGRFLQGGFLHDARLDESGSQLLRFHEDGRGAELWNVRENRKVSEFTSTSGGEFIGVGRALTWGHEGKVDFWRVTGGEKPTLEKTFTNTAVILGVQFDRRGTRLLTWGGDGNAKVWNTSSQTTAVRHHDSITGATFSGDATRIVTWGMDRVVRVWEIDRSGVIQEFPHRGGVVKSSTSGAFVLTSSTNGDVKLWNVGKGEPVHTLHHGAAISGAQFSRDERRLLTWGDGQARVWTVGDTNPVATVLHLGVINGARFNRDESRVLTWSADGTARLSNVTNAAKIRSFDHTNSVEEASLNPDESYLLTLSGGTARLWKASTRELIQILRPGQITRSASFTADGVHILTVDADGVQGKALLWEIGRTNQVRDFAQPDRIIGGTFARPSPISGALLNRDGTRLLTHSYNAGEACLWDIASDKAQTFHPSDEPALIREMFGAIFIRNETCVLTWDWAEARLWEATTGRSMRTFRPFGMASDVALNNSETLFLTWGTDSTVRLWDVELEQPIRAFIHEGPVLGAIFTRDGRRVLTWSQDGLARVWDVSLDEDTPIEERVVEFEVRSATTLGSDGQIRVPSVSEWESKKWQLAEMQKKRLSK
jgi:WD40 repeat protein